MTDDVDVAGNLAQVKTQMADAMTHHGFDPDPLPELIAVSKKQPEDRVRAALEAGHRLFGENRVQEAQARWTVLKTEYADVRLHLIGPLQTNKAGDAVALFDMIETVDRPKLVHKLADAMAIQNRHLPVLVQVNTGAEPQKAGVLAEDLDDLVQLCRDRGLDVKGLMCIPPADDDPALHFALLVQMARDLGLKTLSMGMSGDYPIAAAVGATQVRVGSAIFGPRAG